MIANLLKRRAALGALRRYFSTEAAQNDLSKQKLEFEELKKQIYSVQMKQAGAQMQRIVTIQDSHNAEEGKQVDVPNNITDLNKIDFILNLDRFQVDFSKEIKALYNHQIDFARPRLSTLVEQIYIPKYKAKAFCGGLYGGETPENYSQYGVEGTSPDVIFSDPNRDPNEVILGIESSFDESAASLVNSFGEIKANNQVTQWEQWQDKSGIDPEVAMQKHAENLPKVIEKSMRAYDLKKGDPRLKAIAVTIGPGQEKSLNVGIKLAQQMGKDLGVRVIPVNHVEGHVLTSRFNNNLTQTGPALEFPYVSLLATGKHTQIVLSRGVGLHTILGMSIDSAVGECFDKAYSYIVKHYREVLDNKEARQEFIDKFNQRVSKPSLKIPEGYFDFLDNKKVCGGLFVEKLAQYGDPSETELPLGLKTDVNADMSFTGLKTAI